MSKVDTTKYIFTQLFCSDWIFSIIIQESIVNYKKRFQTEISFLTEFVKLYYPL